MIVGKRRVVFTTPTLAQYRARFHELVRERLQDSDYVLIYGQPDKGALEGGGAADLTWATKIRNFYGRKPIRIVWQPLLGELRRDDFVILNHENRLMVNYLLLTFRRFLGLKVALWGHGRNFQSEHADGVRERWKRRWARNCDWWFTYTDATAEIVAQSGFPRQKITVFRNSIDTQALRELDAMVEPSRMDSARHQLGFATDNVCVYVGGMYVNKRLPFLIEACKLIRDAVPDFEFIVMGAGPDSPVIQASTTEHPWIHYVGPKYGLEKIVLMKLAKACLMPGLVGLAVIDCLTLGLPLITTAYPMHSPEIAYLANGENGLVVEDWESAAAYAKVVVNYLRDSKLQKKLSIGARESGRLYSIESMADLFVDGVRKALSSFAE